jgi:hypothetical protein
MTLVPDATPDTKPVVEPIVAFAIVPLIHVPPGVRSLNDVEPLTQTVAGVPSIEDIGFTVTTTPLAHPLDKE